MGTHNSPAAKIAVGIASLMLLLSPAGAQPAGTPNDGYQYARFSPSMAIIIAILVAALFFMGFFSVYIRHCTDANPASNNSVRGRGGIGASLRRRVAPKGLDPTVIETFPTFAYSAVKGLKIGKGALECAVCINEFEDDETLRLLPKCDHVFHPECIDAWLESHVTCPVCRANLVPQPGEPPQASELYGELTESAAETQNPPNNGEVSIRINDDPIPPIPATLRLPSQKMDRHRSFNLNPTPKSKSIGEKLFGKFPRSHSTGHSLVQPGENTDRFTLRLPVDVRKQVMSRALDRTASCLEMPSEGSSRRGFRTGFGEGGRSFKRIEKSDRVAKSDRWLFSMAPPFFSRASSIRSPKVVAADGEGSTSGTGTATTPRETKTVRFPSFKCLEPKGDEIGLVSTGSPRPAV